MGVDSVPWRHSLAKTQSSQQASTQAEEVKTPRDGEQKARTPAVSFYSTVTSAIIPGKGVLRDITIVTPLVMALFGGNIHLPEKSDTLLIDGLEFKVSGGPEAARTIVELRQTLSAIIRDALQDLVLGRLPRSSDASQRRENFLQGVVDLLNYDKDLPLQVAESDGVELDESGAVDRKDAGRKEGVLSEEEVDDAYQQDLGFDDSLSPDASGSKINQW
ncbi:hypothetical protein LTS18_014294 [Coniosporium uncinatum]|uniref:Uncharacterized protein n=1 Tax=Coniosporium uncinatum TaxID=93489 RepID=A0ACC3CVF4_9PEZI|nr:hypothetical protein LTS18_014294 [Coniosporium uncinatum]